MKLPFEIKLCDVLYLLVYKSADSTFSLCLILSALAHIVVISQRLSIPSKLIPKEKIIDISIVELPKKKRANTDNFTKPS